MALEPSSGAPAVLKDSSNVSCSWVRAMASRRSVSANASSWADCSSSRSRTSMNSSGGASASCLGSFRRAAQYALDADVRWDRALRPNGVLNAIDRILLHGHCAPSPEQRARPSLHGPCRRARDRRIAKRCEFRSALRCHGIPSTGRKPLAIPHTPPAFRTNTAPLH